MYPHPYRFVAFIFFLCCHFNIFAANELPIQPATALVDTIDPQITCPADVVINLPPNTCDTAYQFTIVYTDDQPDVTLVQAQGLQSGDRFPIGVTLNFYVALDAAGNTATCSFNVTVNPVSGPLQCMDEVVVKLDNDCLYLPPVTAFLEPNTFGCPSNYGLEVDKTPPFGNGPWSPALFTAGDINKYYQFRVTDFTTGNKCWGQVLVVDSMPPVLTCTNIVTNCAIESTTPIFLRDSLGFATAFPVVADNCQLSQVAPVFVDLVTQLPCNPTSNGVRKSISRVWTASDLVGNKGSCTQIISLKADAAEVIFPADTTYYDCNASFAPLSFTGTPYFQVGNRRYPVFETQSCGLDANYFDTLVPVVLCDGARRVQRTWKLYDLCGQQPIANFPTISIQIIDIVDTTGPVISCPADVTVDLATVDCSTPVDLPDFIISDPCSRIASLEANYFIHNFNFSLAGTFMDVPGAPSSGYDTLGVMGTIDDVPSGITKVVYTATDDCGNSTICAFNLHVWDKVAPIAVCDSLPTVFLTGGFATDVNAAVFDDGSSDACAPIDFKAKRQESGTCQPNTQFYKQLRFCCADIGNTIPVILRVYDVQLPADSVSNDFAPGQYSDCLVEVIVKDTLPPQCAAPKDTVVLCTNFNPSLPYGSATVISCQVDSMLLSIDYSLFDSTCKKGIIQRNFQTYFNGTAGGQCSQKITVDYVQNYAIRFPDDVIVFTCNGNNDFGTPQVHNMACENIKISYTDETFNIVPDACFKIERLWKITNLCNHDSAAPLIKVPNPNPNAISNHISNLPGPILSQAGTPSPWAPTEVKIFPTDPQPTNYSVFWKADANGFEYKQIIKIIDTQDPIVQNCPGQTKALLDKSDNDPLLWNEMSLYDTLTQQQDLAEGYIDSLTLKATDLCSKDDVKFRYLLFLDLNQDGIQETVLSSTLGSVFGPGFVAFNNYNNPNYTGGTAREFDQRPVTNNQKYRFALQVLPETNGKSARIAWNTLSNPQAYVPAQLPYGRHRVKWFIEDNCGNESVCEYNFTIEDGKEPVVSCKQNVSKTLAANHQVSVNITDLVQNYSDNYTPNSQLLLSTREAGSNLNLFPNGAGLSLAIFTCADTGVHEMELWVRDLNGFESFCTTQVTINDNDGNCDNPPIGTFLTGNVRTELGYGVPQVGINFESTGNNLPYNLFDATFTDTIGNYSIDLSPYPIPYNSVVFPTKDENPQNGVSTFDLLQISKHVLNIQPLNSPYKMIAADVNRSNSITNFDIVEARKLILGLYTEFPNNTSWRFVPVSHTFLNPFNPFQVAFPESIALASQTGFDFMAIKVGDVNTSAQTDSLNIADDRTAGLAVFEVAERDFGAGERFVVHLHALDNLAGYQFSLEYNDLELLELRSESPNVQAHVGLFPQVLTASFETGSPALDLYFEAKRAGKLRDQLRFSDRITTSEAYSTSETLLRPVLHFTNRASSDKTLELFQNVPNPFSAQTMIGFRLPEKGVVQLRIQDQTGRTVYQETKTYEAGYQTINLSAEKLWGPGIYYYELDTEYGRAIKKMTKY